MTVTTNPSTNGPGGATNSGGPGGSVTSADITDATPAGRQVLTAADEAAQRTAIGAVALTPAQSAVPATGVAALDASNVLRGLDGLPLPVGSATTAIAASRTALTADNSATLELASGVTYSLSNAVALPHGVTLMGPASGTAIIAVTGSATINGGTSSITVAANTAYTVLPRAGAPAAFVVRGG